MFLSELAEDSSGLVIDVFVRNYYLCGLGVLSSEVSFSFANQKGAVSS